MKLFLLLSIVLCSLFGSSLGDPTLVTTVQTTKWARNSIMASGHLFVGTNYGIEVYNVMQTVRVVVVETQDFTMGMKAVQKMESGDLKTYLYVASWGKGLLVYDITSVTSITLKSQTTLTGNMMDIAIQDSIAYVLSRDQGLRVFDITQNPSLIINYPISGVQGRRVEVDGDLLFVSTSATQDAILILRTKEGGKVIEEIGQFPTTDKAREVAFGYGKLSSKPTATNQGQTSNQKPNQGPHKKVPFTGPSTTSKGELIPVAYATVEHSGLQLFDMTDKTRPVSLSTVSLPNVATSIAVDSKFAYVGLIGSGFAVVDISNPMAPSHLTTVDTAGHVYGVTLVGSTLYVSDYQGGLAIYDVSA